MVWLGSLGFLGKLGWRQGATLKLLLVLVSKMEMDTCKAVVR